MTSKYKASKHKKKKWTQQNKKLFDILFIIFMIIILIHSSIMLYQQVKYKEIYNSNPCELCPCSIGDLNRIDRYEYINNMTIGGLTNDDVLD